MSKILTLLFISIGIVQIQAQERGSPIPCDLVISALDSHDIYNPNNKKYLFAQIEIEDLNDWQILDTVFLRTITQLNVSTNMFLFDGQIPDEGSSKKEIYEVTIAGAAVYFHSDDNVEFGTNPDVYQRLIARRNNGLVELKYAGYQNGLDDWGHRRKGRWHKFRTERLGLNCLALIRVK